MRLEWLQNAVQPLGFKDSLFEPGGSARCGWSGCGMQCIHPAQGRTVHIFRVEDVPPQPPGFVKDLLPLAGRIRRDLHSAESLVSESLTAAVGIIHRGRSCRP